MVAIKDEDREVDLFKQFLRFRTVSAEGPCTGAYAACVAWLDKLCKEEVPFCETTVVEPVKNKPILVVKLAGSAPELDAVVLNSHYDVVPAMEEFWTVDPWAAVEKDGKIYGRGTQDMKCVGIQYILALGRMYRQAVNDSGDASKVKNLFKRSVFLTYVPDEEIGGKDGMNAFIEGGHLKGLIGSVAVALDEGLANTKPGECTVFYGERLPLWVLVECDGPTGHGSRFIQDTAVEKLIGLAGKAFEERAKQEKILGYTGGEGCKHCEAKKLGDVLTINLTMLQAGVSSDGGKTYSLNVIPTKAKAGFDIRCPLTTPVEEVKALLDDWTKAEGMSWKFDPNCGDYQDHGHAVTSIDAEENIWWKVFSEGCKKAGVKVTPEIFPAGTDSRFLRLQGIAAFGFSPMSNTPILLHEHDEYLEKSVFLQGIQLYETLVPTLANFN
mmetsp:Transcript_11916/g.19404  ORF Transcript_11916/g.19404 Transcript_11916/m.19404 type:complete len:440 (+) Transcript_11916:89-1408(+)|eukprot:CAMPEP_0203764346 /NCGR_PEP_ID=MMETSP0098-20131031/17627_1 /ASSEMBLY_ACC=CAM_ASM_000208 /TAXON_ID=96639 /ORGANISM=" , Strain NY0313808BC1" /LENGTH=439 /DNA_ID=CAMNT_0050660173 /DNA_START=94 /DNA_END=1413 /DNA_ORIENTATION=-